MTDASSLPSARQLIAAAADALKTRADDVNRLNVFPVPDGDTGTNMSLTMDAVVAAVEVLGPSPSPAETCTAVTKGSLMGARGNSGVILSQILRGLCEVIGEATLVDATTLAEALDRAVEVSFQAVRKPVEGTMLTVLKDTAEAAHAVTADASLLDALETAAAAAFASVKRTPELLPVLKENGVVDAGGFGLAILLEGLTAAASGTEVRVADVSSAVAPLLSVAPVDDWDDTEYLYCTEFLLFGDDVQKPMLEQIVSAAGGSELVVGDQGQYKIHVHTNDPGSVLGQMTSLGEVAEVHVNNMRRQQAERDARLKAEHPELAPPTSPAKPIGVVAVASGSGLVEILKSLGADVVVSGGQTMNPSTKDIADAITRANAERIVVLPNNKNIVMAANAAATVADRPVAVVPTHSVPEAFAALLALEPDASDLDRAAFAMGEASQRVRTGEVTTAVKRATSKAGKIKAGQVIGIAADEIEVVGDSVLNVALELSDILVQPEAEMLTVLAGADLSDAELSDLANKLQERHPEIGVETHRGEQPLYPVLMAAE